MFPPFSFPCVEWGRERGAKEGENGDEVERAGGKKIEKAEREALRFWDRDKG